MKKTASFFALALVVAGCGAVSQTTSSSEKSSEEIQIGYGSVSKDKLTTSVSHLNMEEDLTVASYSDFFEYIEGRVPGVTVETVNGQRAIVVRGSVDLFNQITPAMVIVDGVEIQDPSLINPNAIASVDVLKDAASTSIYGLRGAGGVIIITTKK